MLPFEIGAGVAIIITREDERRRIVARYFLIGRVGVQDFEHLAVCLQVGFLYFDIRCSPWHHFRDSQDLT